MGRKAKCSIEEKQKAVEDYINGIRSMSEIMDDLSIKSARSIRDWINAYKEQGPTALLPCNKNQSYSKEFKIKIVEKYLTGEASVTDLCAKYGIKAHSSLQKWISLYNSDMELKDYDPKQEVYMAKARRKTTFEEHTEIVDYCIKHNRNYKDTAALYDVSYSQVYSWVKKYDTNGEDALTDKRGRHKTDDEIDELERLKRENLRLKRQLEEKDMLRTYMNGSVNYFV
ncbi:MAG: helix-turn-helix domain-containing protein [Clostridiales bacterium]|nr:helix-turn-helix domain-containing protein [Clostridiales bacterium]